MYHITLANNSDDILYLDGLCIGQVGPTTTAKPSGWMLHTDMKELPLFMMCWEFPGTGTEYPILPGERQTIATNATDHTTGDTGVPNSLDLSKVEWAQQENVWNLSANPVGIAYEANDSILEANLGYQIWHTALAASDQPDKAQSYKASVQGNRRLGSLWLTGGVGWTQDHLDGREWNLLTQPDYLITAGDSLGERQRTEEYRIFGQAAYALSSRLKLGISGDYSATDNQDRSPYRTYGGKAYRTRIAGGLTHEARQRRGEKTGAVSTTCPSRPRS